MSETFRTSIDIDAPQDQVFDYFVRPELLVRWMGDFAHLEATAAGLFSVDINGVLIRGHFVRLERPNLIEIAWGEAGNSAMPPGATRLVVSLAPHRGGTRVTLEHSGLVPAEAEKHAIGWPHFIQRLGLAARGLDPGPDPWKAAPPHWSGGDGGTLTDSPGRAETWRLPRKPSAPARRTETHRRGGPSR